jgi:hypothetical protein
MKLPKVKSAVAGLLTATCLVGLSFEASGQLAGATRPGTGQPVKLAGADLISYANCAQMLREVKAEALEEVGPYGLPASDGAFWTSLGTDGVAGPRVLAPSALLPSGGQPAYSTTNDQEAGVDEPDVVKTDGQIMVVLRQQPIGVQVIDVSGPAPQLDGFLPLPQLASADGLFLVGQDVVVLGDEFGGSQPYGFTGSGGGPVPGATPAPGPVLVPVPTTPVPLPATAPVPTALPIPTTSARRAVPVRGTASSGPARVIAPLPVYFPVEGAQSTTDVVVVSVANPDSPTVQRTFSFQGEQQGARLINGQVVLALTNQPRLRWFYPLSGTAAAEKAATAANKEVIESSGASDWLPSLAVRSGPGGGSSASTVARNASCSGTYHTVVSSGLGTLSLVSFDPTSNSPGNEVTVVGNAENVYASATQVFVATTAWQYQVVPGCRPLPGEACPLLPADVVWPIDNASTDIYGFDISDPGAPQYLGSGTVPGTLIGQYAMSEYDAYLRVATTVGEPTPAPVDGEAAPAQLSDNMVSVLQPQNGSLVTVGALHGLGEGEKIYSVRFIGDLGYVVTFNQTDPLYIVDLSNPDQPVLAGQVSLSGYSSLLQPLSSGLLLGVGQSVDQELRTQGLQVEVFNVADPAQPSLVSEQELGDGAGSAAEYDPHALLWWPQASLLVMPVDDYSGSGPSSAADLWSVSSSGTLDQVGTLSQPGSPQDGYPEIERAVVVGSDIYTLSEQGVMANDISSLTQVAWLAYQNSSS